MAFDSINLNMLIKSMKRIKLPDKFNKISTNILQNKETKIINKHNSPNKIQIKSGIDQGDSISPLWWIIFYDPLISKLEKTSSNNNFTNTLAYMDNLNLLANSQNTLQKLLNITTSFFKLNDITANPIKTKLITTNKILRQIKMNNQIIPAQSPNQSIRILGIWISEKSILHPNRQKISEETTQIKKALQRKIITGAMATYIYNKVLLPRIEYKLQTTFLIPNMIKTTQRIIDSTIKHKFQLE